MFPRKTLAFSLLLAAGLISILLAAGRRVVYETQSKYNHIIVEEDEKGLRYLLFSETGGYQSVRRPGETEVLELPYSRVMVSGLALVPDMKRCLIIGLGGGSIPSFLHARFPDLRIDCVDIDPEVIKVAKRFFGFMEDDFLKAHAADGRKFIEESRDRYDVIFLDAFGNDFIPYTLATREFLESVKKVLAPGGIILGNVWGRVSNRLYDSMMATYKAVFDEVCILTVPERSNIIVIAVPRKGKLSAEDLAKKAEALAKARKFSFDSAALVRAGFQDLATVQISDPVLEDKDEELHKPPEAPAED